MTNISQKKEYMKRLLLDTNIYGELIFDGDFTKLKAAIPKKYVIHGFKVVRDELRDLPKEIKVEGKNLRIGLLHIYDELTKKSYGVTEEMAALADDYYVNYRQMGGSKSKDKIYNDFLIVACASSQQIDVVVSEDTKTMLVENALKAYNLVNNVEKMKTPNFIGYLEFKRWLI